MEARRCRRCLLPFRRLREPFYMVTFSVLGEETFGQRYQGAADGKSVAPVSLQGPRSLDRWE